MSFSNKYSSNGEVSKIANIFSFIIALKKKSKKNSMKLVKAQMW